MSDDATSLYRHFAADGSLLYVGISLSWPARTKAHAGGSRWFDKVAKVEIEQFPSREAALDAERNAIKAEKPAFNVVHNREPSNRPQKFPRPALSSAMSSRRFMGSKERQRHDRDLFKQWGLDLIKGPDAVVGPALIYRDDIISMMVGQGEAGSEGHLVEIVLGEWWGELPAWADAVDTVMTIRTGNQLTMDEARETRDHVVKLLRKGLQTVEAFDTDVSLAVAYASRFPSEAARKILNDVCVERGASS